MQKTHLFFVLATGYFVFSLALSVIAPFFPSFAVDRGISEDVVGLIYSANPIGAVIAAVILGKIVNDVFQFKFLFLEKPIHSHCFRHFIFGCRTLLIFGNILPGKKWYNFC